MLILPAIDLIEGQAVRLLRGDYARKTVYSDSPVLLALKMKEEGASALHLVDLQGASSGNTPNRETICRIKAESGLFCEAGGGIRDMSTLEYYISRGIDRVILGSAAVRDPEFLRQAVREYGDRIAVGLDLKEGRIAVHGWKETEDIPVSAFLGQLAGLGVKTLICTDISRDGALRGANLELYRSLSGIVPMDIIASGGISGTADIKALKEMKLYGAILGKAYYEGTLSLPDALEAAHDN